MLSLLLDENISPQVAVQIQRKRPDTRIDSINTWRHGMFKSESDELILTAAAAEETTLVTYDQRTIMHVLMQWGYVGTDRTGVIFVDDLSISTHDFGSIIRLIIALRDSFHQENWTNVITYLRPD